MHPTKQGWAECSGVRCLQSPGALVTFVVSTALFSSLSQFSFQQLQGEAHPLPHNRNRVGRGGGSRARLLPDTNADL